MLNFDNTVNYAPSFKKIDESIESINTLLTSLLLDTYTNQTFIYSDINVIRVNTSQNYESIQSLSSSLPYKFDASDSTNFFMKSNSGIFASTSTLSDKMNISDYDSVSGDFFMKSNSTQFALSSELSSKFNVSDSTQFALQSDFEQQISEKLDITDFSLYSLDFASTSQLSSKFNVSDSTNFFIKSNSSQFASTSQLSSKFNVSDSTFFLPSSNYSTEYLSDISKFIETHTTYYSSSTAMNVSFNNIIYNMYPTSFSLPSNVILSINNQPLLYSLSLTGNLEATNITVRNFHMESAIRAFLKNDNINGFLSSNDMALTNCIVSGSILKNTLSGYYYSIDGMIASNSFDTGTRLDLHAFNEYTESNTYQKILYINSHAEDDHPIVKNSIDSCSTIYITGGAYRSNTFSNGINYDLRVNYNMSLNNIGNIDVFNANLHNINAVYESNSFSNISTLNLSGYWVNYNSFSNITSLYFDNLTLYMNTFSNCEIVNFNFREDDRERIQENTFNNVKYVNLNIAPKININIGRLLGLGKRPCSIGGININIPPGDCRKSEFEDNITRYPYYLQSHYPERLMSLSFNSTNDWINSGFGDNLSSWAKNNLGIFWNYSGTSKLNVQGSIVSSTGKITDLANKYFQPKFSPNYNSLKHYMILYGDSFRDYFELDPHALEAGHNNNACENILLQKDYTFYSTLATAAGKDSYTFIQWPSTEITFPKSDYSNNTLLNTITDITNSISNLASHTLCYKFGYYTLGKYSYVEYMLASSLASQLANTSSSSQIYAGFSYSGLLTSTASTSSYIQY